MLLRAPLRDCRLTVQGQGGSAPPQGSSCGPGERPGTGHTCDSHPRLPTCPRPTRRPGAAPDAAHTRDQPGCFWGSGSRLLVAMQPRKAPEPQPSATTWDSAYPSGHQSLQPPHPAVRIGREDPKAILGGTLGCWGVSGLHLPLTGSELSWREGREARQLWTASRAPRGHRWREASPVTVRAPPPRAWGTDKGAAGLRPRGPLPAWWRKPTADHSSWCPGRSPRSRRSAREGWAPSETEWG